MKKILKSIGIVLMIVSLNTISVSLQASSIPDDPPGGIIIPPPPPPPPPIK